MFFNWCILEHTYNSKSHFTLTLKLLPRIQKNNHLKWRELNIIQKEWSPSPQFSLSTWPWKWSGSHYRDNSETYHIPCLYTSTDSIYSSHTLRNWHQTRDIITLYSKWPCYRSGCCKPGMKQGHHVAGVESINRSLTKVHHTSDKNLLLQISLKDCKKKLNTRWLHWYDVMCNLRCWKEVIQARY